MILAKQNVSGRVNESESLPKVKVNFTPSANSHAACMDGGMDQFAHYLLLSQLQRLAF